MIARGAERRAIRSNRGSGTPDPVLADLEFGNTDSGGSMTVVRVD